MLGGLWLSNSQPHSDFTYRAGSFAQQLDDPHTVRLG
jgi:hypothetical protein